MSRWPAPAHCCTHAPERPTGRNFCDTSQPSCHGVWQFRVGSSETFLWGLSPSCFYRFCWLDRAPTEFHKRRGFDSTAVVPGNGPTARSPIGGSSFFHVSCAESSDVLACGPFINSPLIYALFQSHGILMQNTDLWPEYAPGGLKLV